MENNNLTLDEYQQLALETATYPNPIIYPTLGLTGEAGEVSDKVKKVLRDNDSVFTDEKKLEIAKEIGDVLWFCATLSHDIGFKLSDIGKMNYDKLHSRQLRGKLHGSGDNRQFMVWYSKVKGLTEKVFELYPTMSSREIADATGFAKTTIIRCAAKNHLRHTEETQKRIDEYVRQRRSSGRKSYDYSKLSKKITHTRKMESWRVRSGLEQNTKYKVRITPKRIQNAMYHLRQKYGYFYETVDKTELYYDSQTRRVKNENYYTEKYGISFILADE